MKTKMKSNRLIVHNAIRSSMLLTTIAIVASCAEKKPIVHSTEAVRHLIETKNENQLLYLDKINSEQFLKKSESDEDVNYAAFKIGFEDEVLIESKKREETQKYFDYEMWQDWKALHNGDTVSASFFLPQPSLRNTVREGILVFEVVGKEKKIDTLVYKDGMGYWNTQVIVLND